MESPKIAYRLNRNCLQAKLPARVEGLLLTL
jgi:hypothetical protein